VASRKTRSRKRHRSPTGDIRALIGRLALTLAAVAATAAADTQRIELREHRVAHRSTAPANAGEAVPLYLREKRAPAAIAGTAPGAGRVVLLVHGGITPAVPAFDLAFGDYSWMDALARAGFVVYALDHSGYGSSPRPGMDDPCNLSPADRARIDAAFLPSPCPPSHRGPATTRESDWDELRTVVDFIRARHGVERIDLLGWSLGGPRAGGFAARHPERVDRLVLYSPAYSRRGVDPGDPPAHPLRLLDREAVTRGRWARSIACDDAVEAGVRDAIWSTMMRVDPLGAAWGAPEGLLRLRRGHAVVEGSVAWDRAGAGRIEAPTLILTGEQDNPARKHQLYDDLVGAEQRVIATLSCATHYALWERSGHRRLHAASVDWLARGRLGEATRGRFRLDEQGRATADPH
jgi:pimeloyl-ACP methyl ester carboxylesterase